jgi:multidrug efflux pump subunit AcrA (membrane-fusion protein)
MYKSNAEVTGTYRKMPATSADCVRASQVISKLDRTQTAEELLSFAIATL